MRWAGGRVGTERLMIGWSRTGCWRMPSKGEGESGSGELGISIGEMRRVGDADGDSSLSTPASLPLSTLACLLIATPLSGGPKVLGGRASGLEGRPVAWLLIWLGLRTNGEAFSGDREPILSGVPAVDDFVGELVGVVSLWPACEFCLRNGDWRTLPVSDPAGERVAARNEDYGAMLLAMLAGSHGKPEVYTPCLRMSLAMLIVICAASWA
jgi:hypothetical protein